MFGLFLFWILWFKDVQPGLFFIRIFRVLNTVQSFIFKVHFVVAFVLSSNSFILSQLLAFVNNFFNFFQLFIFLLKLTTVFRGGALIYHFIVDFVKGFFQIFLLFFSYSFHALYLVFFHLLFHIFPSPSIPNCWSHCTGAN